MPSARPRLLFVWVGPETIEALAAGPEAAYAYSRWAQSSSAPGSVSCVWSSTSSGSFSLGFGWPLLYVFFGILAFVLIITIPFGFACFRIAGFALWPFGRRVVRRPGAGAPSS
jgi:hypothetical protein